MGCCIDVEGMDEDLSQVIIENPCFVVDRNWAAQKLTTLVIQEKLFSFSGDDFSVTDAETSQPVLKVKGKALVWNSLMNMTDLSGNVIAILDEKTKLTGYNTFQIQDGNKQVLGIIKKKFTVGAEEYELQSPDSVVLYNITGTFFGHRFIIRNAQTNQIVAKCGRSFLQYGGKDTYGLVIAQGVDLVAMTCICCAIDEYNEKDDKNKKRKFV